MDTEYACYELEKFLKDSLIELLVLLPRHSFY